LKTRRSFASPEIYRRLLSASEWEACEQNFELCRRLKAKDGQIKAEFNKHAEWRRDQIIMHSDERHKAMPSDERKKWEEWWDFESQVTAKMIKEFQKEKGEMKSVPAEETGETVEDVVELLQAASI
jgi:hypothetical protein